MLLNVSVEINVIDFGGPSAPELYKSQSYRTFEFLKFNVYRDTASVYSIFFQSVLI